jgi:hypothetical protein
LTPLAQGNAQVIFFNDLTHLYKIFTHRSTHWGNLFVDVGKANLGNKMMSYTTYQKVFIIKLFKSSGGSSTAVERECRPQFSVRVAPSRNTIYRILKQFEDTDGVRDKRARPRKNVNAAHLFARKKLSAQNRRQ